MKFPPTCSAAHKTGGVPHKRRAYSRLWQATIRVLLGKWGQRRHTQSKGAIQIIGNPSGRHVDINPTGHDRLPLGIPKVDARDLITPIPMAYRNDAWIYGDRWKSWPAGISWQLAFLHSQAILSGRKRLSYRQN